jgi:hypothetical protein
MREERVDTGNGLLRILRINFEFGFAVFLRDGENSQGCEGFERIGRLGAQHAGAKVKIIGGIHKDQASGASQNKTFKNDSKGCHCNVVTLPQTEENGDAASLRDSRRRCVRYNMSGAVQQDRLA